MIAFWGHLSYFIRDFHEFLILIVLTIVVCFAGTYFIFKSALPENRKKLFISILFFILSLVLIYSGFEAYFRYKFDQSDALGFLNTTDRWMARHVVFNNYQVRDRDFQVSKTPGVVRIAVMGDSLAFGYGIKNVNDRFSNILQDKLNESGYKVEVYNFGVSGLDTWNELINYNTKIKQFKPDIVVWEYYLNDAEPKDSKGNAVLDQVSRETPPFVEFLTNHSFFLDYLYWRFSAIYTNTFNQLKNTDLEQYYIPAVFKQHVNDIASLSAQLKAENSQTVTVIFPFLRFMPNYPILATQVHQKMDKVFANDGVTVIDLLPYLKNKNATDLVVNRWDTHPNEYIHQFVAEKLYNAIVPMLTKTDQGTFIKTQ